MKTPPRYRSWLRLVLTASVLGFLGLFPGEARAFEREWHLGGGVGAASPSGDYDLGPAITLYGAYGISDVFDVRLELAGSRHGIEQGDDVTLVSGALGLVYKIDIIQWVPWIGATGGYYLATPKPLELAGLPESSLAGGLTAGLDYALTRSVGLGASFREDFLLDEGTNVTLLFFRAEYRFGW
jgi:hypothetical protein